MPALPLSEIEDKRVAAGLCACGCGEPLPENGTDWRGNPTRAPGRRTAGGPCRKRLYRRRVREGRSVPMDERKRQAKLKAAKELEKEAKRHDNAVEYYEKAAKRCRAAAERLLSEAGAGQQTTLPV